MITVEGLTKTFGSKVAVDGISFGVERGEVLGFLGPNGAGKSTTMRMITGFIPPTLGSVSVGGYDIIDNPILAKSMLGYLPENAPSYADMTVSGFLNFCAQLRGLRGAEKNQAVARAIEMCFLESVRYQSIETLSKGFRHRTCFAQSILHDPDVLVMDEPTDGLDPNQKHEMRTLIRRMGEKKAIIFSTHILEEVEAVCSRAIIIDRGRIVANGTPAELKLRADTAGAVYLKVINQGGEEVKKKLGSLATVGKVRVLEQNGSGVDFRIYPQSKSDSSNMARSVADLVVQESWSIEQLRIEEGRLDDVFRSITLPETVQEKQV